LEAGVPFAFNKTSEHSHLSNPLNRGGILNIKEYTEHLRGAGEKVLAGSDETVWVSLGPFVMQRRPYFASQLPSREELQGVFSESHAAILNFTESSSEFSRSLYPNFAPGPTWSVPSYLYVCTDREYSYENLSQSARSHIRRSLNEFEIRFLDAAEILTAGMDAFCDTRIRFGLSKGTRQAFEATFCQAQSFRRYLGAFKDNRLAAFVVITEIDDWASIGPGYAVSEFLPLRPNNGLIFRALRYYLVEEKRRLVDHGLSNVPFTAKVESLHRFKVKMGFEARPVHRSFVVNPLLRPFVNRLSWKLVNGLQKLSPRIPLVEQTELVLRMALRTPQSAEVLHNRYEGTVVRAASEASLEQSRSRPGE